ncbi:MAG TPA: nuclear transport factor 2 family protein [Edaphobacter sp.]|nr:nuclear transport factor 2 family protein [Edaphobacter sp.]
MALRLRLALCFVAIALAIPAESQHQSLSTVPQQQLDVIKVLLAQEEAWNRGDLEAFAQTYKDSPDTVLISGAVNHGFAGLLDAYRKNYPDRAAMGTLSFSELEVHPLDERFAVVVGRYSLERSKKDGGNAQGVFSLVLEKTEKGWKIIVDHTTS